MEETMIGYLLDLHGIVEESLGGRVVRRFDGSVALQQVRGNMEAVPLPEEIISFAQLYGKMPLAGYEL